MANGNSTAFGDNCKRTPLQPDVSPIEVATNEYLKYQVVARGAEPVFAFVATTRKANGQEETMELKADDFPNHPTDTYEWTWPQVPPAGEFVWSRQRVRFDFTGALEYTLKVEKWRIVAEQNKFVETVKRVHYKCEHTQTTAVEDTLSVYPPN